MTLPIAIAISLAIGSILTILGMLWWFRRGRTLLAQEWEDVAHYHQQHADRLRLDDTRLGINTGIEFAVEGMQESLNGLRKHIEERIPA